MIERLLAATAIDTLQNLEKKQNKRGAKPPVYKMRIMYINRY